MRRSCGGRLTVSHGKTTLDPASEQSSGLKAPKPRTSARLKISMQANTFPTPRCRTDYAGLACSGCYEWCCPTRFLIISQFFRDHNATTPARAVTSCDVIDTTFPSFVLILAPNHHLLQRGLWTEHPALSLHKPFQGPLAGWTRTYTPL